MDIVREIQGLIRAKEKLENRVKDLDAKIEHVLFRMKEEKRCFARNCPLDEPTSNLERP